MPSFFRLQAALYLKRAVILLAVLGITAYLYFVLQATPWQQAKESLMFWKEKPQAEETDSNTDSETELRLGSFEEFLARSSPQQLILRSTELVDDPNKDLIVRLDSQQKKIQIADKLIENSDNARAVEFGTLSKLTALRKRELFKFDNGLASDDSISELTDFSEQHFSAANSDIGKQAQLGQLLGRMLAELVKSNDDSLRLSDGLHKMFTDFCSQNREDMAVSTELFDYLERIYVHSPPEQHLRFVSSFRDIYNESENENLRVLATRISKTLAESEFELLNIFDSIESLQLEAADKLYLQISDALKLGTISHRGYIRLFNAIRDIARVRQYEKAAELGRGLLSKLETNQGENLKNLTRITSKFCGQMQLYEQELDFNGVIKLDGNPFSLRYPDAEVKAVVFMTHQAFRGSDQLLFDTLKIAGTHINSKRFCISAIYIDPGNVTEATTALENVASIVTVIDFCRIDMNSEQGKNMVKTLSMLESPMMMLLDKESKIVGINVFQKDFERTFFELMSRE